MPLVVVLACGGEKPPPCAPGGRACDGNTLITCSLDGKTFTETRCLANFQVCSQLTLECVESPTGRGGGASGTGGGRAGGSAMGGGSATGGGASGGGTVTGGGASGGGTVTGGGASGGGSVTGGGASGGGSVTGGGASGGGFVTGGGASGGGTGGGTRSTTITAVQTGLVGLGECVSVTGVAMSAVFSDADDAIIMDGGARTPRQAFYLSERGLTIAAPNSGIEVVSTLAAPPTAAVGDDLVVVGMGAERREWFCLDTRRSAEDGECPVRLYDARDRALDGEFYADFGCMFDEVLGFVEAALDVEYD